LKETLSLKEVEELHKSERSKHLTLQLKVKKKWNSYVSKL